MTVDSENKLRLHLVLTTCPKTMSGAQLRKSSFTVEIPNTATITNTLY